LEKIAPPGLGQSWDNVGLQVGDGAAVVRRVLLCIDLTPAVLREAARRKAGLVIAYHPPIFKPVSRILAGGQGMESVVFECIRRQIALYSTHTALDAADGGTNDVLAALCGVKDAAPIEWVDEPGVSEVKLVVFVPQASLERVADAIFEAGAGHIGDYSRCSYRLSGQGTFFGGDSTNPTIGERGRMEFVDEVRLESVVDAKKLPAVIRAMIEGHPYEEPAYDIYPLTPKPVRGIGRVGALARSTTLGKLARKLKRATAACCVQIVGPAERVVERAVVCAGAAGSIPFQVPLGERDVIVTGEIRHHDALMIERCGCCAVALGHWASERPVLKPLAERLGGMVSGVDFVLSEADREPFGPV
jgi:dinuclear metal center YbgI/SA1388 family protein